MNTYSYVEPTEFLAKSKKRRRIQVRLLWVVKSTRSTRRDRLPYQFLNSSTLLSVFISRSFATHFIGSKYTVPVSHADLLLPTYSDSFVRQCCRMANNPACNRNGFYRSGCPIRLIRFVVRGIDSSSLVVHVYKRNVCTNTTVQFWCWLRPSIDHQPEPPTANTLSWAP